MDKFSRKTRSKIMSSIRSKNTKPELAIRKILWSRGVRYRIHDSSIFGKPDISIKRNKLAVFIDGCFWHACEKCYSEPKTNSLFWRKKIQNNKIRRDTVRKKLTKNGWNLMEFWEHEVKLNSNKIADSIERKISRIKKCS